MEQESKKSAEERVVDRVIARYQTDTAFLAALKRADNPATEYQSWEYLADLGIDIGDKNRRLPFTTVLAALARAKPKKDGGLDFGKAIVRCFDDDKKSSQARSRLRRILSCDSVDEVCAVIRPLFRLIESRGVPLSYAKILRLLVWFNADPQRAKATLAQSFFDTVTEVA